MELEIDLKDKKYGKSYGVLIIIWIVLISLSRLIPTFPLLGTGGNFSLNAVIIPLSGIFFGPVVGTFVASAGSFIGTLLVPTSAWLGYATFIISAVNAFTAALISRSYWKQGVSLLLLFTIFWFTTATGRANPIVTVIYYGFGLAVMITGGYFCRNWFLSKKPGLVFLSLWISAFTGMVTAGAFGNYLNLVFLDLDEELWNMLAFIAPFERVFFAIGSAIMGSCIFYLFWRKQVFLGPNPYPQSK